VRKLAKNTFSVNAYFRNKIFFWRGLIGVKTSADVRLAEALRTTLGAAGRKLHKYVTVEIIETD